jgi:hypothetical protein
VYAVGELQKDIGKSSGEWRFDLEGKDKRSPEYSPPNMPEFAKAFGCKPGEPLVREGLPGMVEKCAALGLGPRVDFWKDRRGEDRARGRGRRG